MSSFKSELSNQLKKDVYDLCRPEGRMVGSTGHAVAEDFLRTRLEQSGCVPYAGENFDLRYKLSNIDFNNLVGVVPGKNRELPPVLVGAHYDSVIDAPCADDNGAAVAISLSIARAASNSDGLERDLIVALFDAEEPPYFLSEEMGSNYFYKQQLNERGIHFALIFDLVGHDVSLPAEMIPVLRKFPGMGNIDIGLPFLKNLVFMTGAESETGLSKIVKDVGLPKNLKLIATLNKNVGDMSDHGVFRRNDIPYLFLSCGRWAHYHQVTDTPDRLNYNKMARIAKLSAGILEQAAYSKLMNRSSHDHTLDFEIETLQQGLGIVHPFLLRQLGLNKVETRDDLDKIVHGIMSLGL